MNLFGGRESKTGLTLLSMSSSIHFSINISEKPQFVSITKLNLLMLFWKIILRGSYETHK